MMGFGMRKTISERLKKVNGKWALVSKDDPNRVLQYYHGPKGKKPSEEWVKKVERRIQMFKHMNECDCHDDPHKAAFIEYIKDGHSPVESVELVADDILNVDPHDRTAMDMIVNPKKYVTKFMDIEPGNPKKEVDGGILETALESVSRRAADSVSSLMKIIPPKRSNPKCD